MRNEENKSPRFLAPGKFIHYVTDMQNKCTCYLILLWSPVLDAASTVPVGMLDLFKMILFISAFSLFPLTGILVAFFPKALT